MNVRDTVQSLLAQAEMTGSSPETNPPRKQIIEAQLPELSQDTMQSLGVEIINAALDQAALQEAAERNSEMRRSHLAIVRGPDQLQYLLKGELDISASKLERWQQFERFQHEVIASRLGRLVQYSVLPNTIVWWNNAVHIGTPYQTGSDDVNDFDTEEFANPEAIHQRFVFNAWINSIHDGASQAIQTSDKHYIAVDTWVSSDGLPPEATDEARWERVKKIAARKGFGEVFTSDESQSHIEDMIRRIQRVSDAEIETMFADYLGPTDERERIVATLKWRRDHISEIAAELQGEESEG